jgi:two-component system response regulator NreC
MDKTKVLLVDDHQIIIDGLKSLLENIPTIEVVGEALNGKKAIDLLALISVNLVLMDIDMPILNGIETTKLIKSKYTNVKVIILSMYKESGLIKTLIDAGADGYLLKNSDQNELLEAIAKVTSGQQYFSSDVTLSLLNKNSSNSSSFQEENVVGDLTDREIEILKLIAEGFTNKEIGDKLFISHRTVDTHRTNLMKKVGVNNIAGLIRFAIKKGFGD